MDDPIYEPRCPTCRRFDADCNCDWPLPAKPPYEADDEDLEEPRDA